MKSRFASQSGTEALFNRIDTDFSSRNATGSSGSGFPTSTIHSGTNPAVLNDSSPLGKYNTGKGMTTVYGEALGDDSGNAFAEMVSQLRKLL